jgi:hypothetical protein
MFRSLFRFIGAAMMVVAAQNFFAQSIPDTAGETLSSKRIILADAIRGHTCVLVAGFSREAGTGAGAWVKAIHADPVLANVGVYQVAMLASAPAFVRGMIRNGMKKGLSPTEQDNFVVLTDDEKLWKSFFEVADDTQPYIGLIDAQGKVLWHGHGSPANLEPQLRAALH